MGIKDQTKHYSSLTGTVPNTVSRNTEVGERSFAQVVMQSGKPVLDSELNEVQDLRLFMDRVLRLRECPSGVVRSYTRSDGYDDYSFGVPPGNAINTFNISRMEALVAGFPLVVEYAGTATPGTNVVTLEIPQIYDGTPNTVKRSDFVYLEVWQALVAPSPTATGTITVDTPNDGDTVTVDGIVLTAKLVPAVATDFQIDALDAVTAQNLAAKIVTEVATANGSWDGTATLTVSAASPGAAGNAITLATSDPANFILSGGTLTGGADRPNKPAQDKIYRHGNVQSDTATWLDDEMSDPIVISETAQRIQVQYRFRVTGTTEAVNFKEHPDGFSNTPNTTLAQGSQVAPVAGYPFVRADGSASSLNSDAATYGFVDDGLWIAGDGSTTAATDLGTLDGYVYAIPICMVFRRNNCSDVAAAIKGFDPLNNTNGGPVWGHGGYAGVLGAVPAGESDRPDNQFADVISATDILDLRRHVLPKGVHPGELQYQMQSLLDGNYKTWAIDTASKQELGSGSGDVSTQFLVCNEIGRTNASGGVAPVSGDTTRGETIRNFDHIARRFGDQPVVERFTVAFYPGDRPDGIAQGGPVAPGTANAGKYIVKVESGGLPVTTDTWYEGDVIHLDLSELDATTIGSIFDGSSPASSGAGLPNTDINSFFPAGTAITDILDVRHDDGNFNIAVSQQVQMGLIQGIGTPHVEITLDANGDTATGGLNVLAYNLVGSALPPNPVDTASPRRIFVEFEVTYPLGAGCTDTPDLEVTPNSATLWPQGPLLENDITQQPPDMENPLDPNFRTGFREIQVEYLASLDGASNPIVDQIVSQDQTILKFPRRVYGSAGNPVTVDDNPAAAAMVIDVAATEYGSSSREVTITAPLSGQQTLCDITYFAQDPIPNYGPNGGGYQVSVYYRSNAPQTAGIKEGAITTSTDGTVPTVLTVEPLLMSDNLWTGQVGMGSVELPYPYYAPLDQIPIDDGGAALVEEWYFAATASTSIDDFNANTGLLMLHSFVPVDGTGLLTLGGVGVGETPEKDAEFRCYYPYADVNSYRPTAMSQPLSGAVRHKVFLPFLARATADVPGTAGGILYRKNEILLVVLSRFAELDETNDIRFVDSTNRTCAGVYKTKNHLLIAGN